MRKKVLSGQGEGHPADDTVRDWVPLGVRAAVRIGEGVLTSVQ